METHFRSKGQTNSQRPKRPQGLIGESPVRFIGRTLLTRSRRALCPARHGEQRSHRGAIGFGLREGRLQAGYPSTRAGLERVVAFAPFHKHHSPSRQNSLRTRTVTLDPIGPSGQARLVRERRPRCCPGVAHTLLKGSFVCSRLLFSVGRVSILVCEL